jgi:hypothetical protein
MTTKQLTVHNASINTATIEVKTLTIGARQVTQGIFRQLIEAPLIAEDGTLNGVPWGHVTWHPDKCEGHTLEHWHIVWQSGTELRRSRVDVKPDFVWNHELRDYVGEPANRFVTAWIREACHGRADWSVLLGTRHEHELTSRMLRGGVNNETKVHAWASVSDAAYKAAGLDRRAPKDLERILKPLTDWDMHYGRIDDWRAKHPDLASAVSTAIAADIEIALTRSPEGDFEVGILTPPAAVELGRVLQAEENALLELLMTKRNSDIETWIETLGKRSEAVAALDAEVSGWGQTWPEIRAEYDAAIRAEAARRQRHRDVRATLAQLPQLFIGG